MRWRPNLRAFPIHKGGVEYSIFFSSPRRLADLPVLEAGSFDTGATDAAAIIAGRICEDTNLEIVSQFEVLAARSHACEVVCSHLYRERMPLQTRLANHPEH